MWCFNKLVITVMISNIRPFIWIIDPDISRKHVRALGKALNKIKKDSIKKHIQPTFCSFDQHLVSKLFPIDKWNCALKNRSKKNTKEIEVILPS